MSLDVERTLQANIVLEHRMWRTQRIGWIIIIVLVLCGLTRLVGEGLTSLVYEGNPSFLAVSFDRVEGDQTLMKRQLSLTSEDEKDSSLSHLEVRAQ